MGEQVMPSKSVTQILQTVAATDAQIEFSLSDATSAHPGCLSAIVTLRDGERAFVWVQNAVKDASGNVTSRVPAAPFTAAQVTALRGALLSVFNAAAASAGYT